MVCAVLCSVLDTAAKQPERGYRGFVDWTNDVYGVDNLLGGKTTVFYTGVSTSHGYQINPYLFVGAGFGLQFDAKDNHSARVPAFLQARTDLSVGKFTPFVDLRGGYNLTQGGGMYLSPNIGYRFNWGRGMGVNVGLGMSFLENRFDVYNTFIDPVTGYLQYVSVGKVSKKFSTFSFRVGIDF